MANNNKKGGGKFTPHSGLHGDARKFRTAANKLRRATRMARIWANSRSPERVARIVAARKARYTIRRAARKAVKA